MTTTPTRKVFTWQKILLWLAIALMVSFCLAPVLWQILTSFKLNEDIAAVPTKYFPSRYTLNHYIELFTRRPFWRYILNSAFVSIISTFVSLVIGSPAAYALARLRPWGGQVMLASVLIVTLFPRILLFLGLLEIIQSLKLGNNYLALIIPYTAINLPH
jgi:multiple sugar transport system permease protein